MSNNPEISVMFIVFSDRTYEMTALTDEVHFNVEVLAEMKAITSADEQDLGWFLDHCDHIPEDLQDKILLFPGVTSNQFTNQCRSLIYIDWMGWLKGWVNGQGGPDMRLVRRIR